MKYGDMQNVKKDVQTLNEILSRQGVSLLVDVIAENIGNIAIKYKLSSEEIKNYSNILLAEISDAINERT